MDNLIDGRMAAGYRGGLPPGYPHGSRSPAGGSPGAVGKIPFQVFREKFGKAMNLLRERVDYAFDYASGKVVPRTGSVSGSGAHLGENGALLNKVG